MRWKSRAVGALSSGLLGGFGALAASPAAAAERVIVSLGILSDSIKISSLEQYAETGEAPPDLYDFLRFVPPEQREAVQSALTVRAELGTIPVAQFLYSPQGEILLERLGQVIESEARQSGFYAIRAALILAAADQENGLSLLNVLKKYPTTGIRISLGRSLEISRELGGLVEESQRATRTLEQAAKLQAEFEPQIDWNLQPDLRRSGLYTWNVRSLELSDPTRLRRFPVDLYLPQYSLKDLGGQEPDDLDLEPDASKSDASNPDASNPDASNPDVSNVALSRSEPGLDKQDEPRSRVRFPLIVLSHGLGSDRTAFVYLAEHLVSHGYAVAVPEHPGSSAAQFDALIRGRAAEVSEPREFLDRPLDITYLLDALAENDALSPALDLDNVGVIGQSFGGYTALALGGAQLNLEQLQQDCAELDRSWNVSLALQCRALVVANGSEQLRDERVKAVMALNPVAGSVLGEAGLSKLDVPVFVWASDSDTVAPALLEQIRPFRGIQRGDRYFALLVGGTHFSFVEEGDIPLPVQIAGPDLLVARRYAKATSLAFFNTYLNDSLVSADYLSSRYAQSIRQGRLGFSLLRNLPEKLR